MPSVTWTTGMVVYRWRISGRIDLWGGLRCWTTTKAIPELGGMLVNSCSKAASPPAEAPIPTTWNWIDRSSSDSWEGIFGAGGRSSSDNLDFLTYFCSFVIYLGFPPLRLSGTLYSCIIYHLTSPVPLNACVYETTGTMSI